jgi:hypothetical protein
LGLINKKVLLVAEANQAFRGYRSALQTDESMQEIESIKDKNKVILVQDEYTKKLEK